MARRCGLITPLAFQLGIDIVGLTIGAEKEWAEVRQRAFAERQGRSRQEVVKALQLLESTGLASSEVGKSQVKAYKIGCQPSLTRQVQQTRRARFTGQVDLTSQTIDSKAVQAEGQPSLTRQVDLTPVPPPPHASPPPPSVAVPLPIPSQSRIPDPEPPGKDPGSDGPARGRSLLGSSTAPRVRDRALESSNGKPSRPSTDDLKIEIAGKRAEAIRASAHTSEFQRVSEALFKHWNGFGNLVTHRILTPVMKAAVKERLKEGYREEDFFKAVARYSELKLTDAAPGYGDWTLAEFLTRGRGQFIDKHCDPNWEGFTDRAPKSKEERLTDYYKDMIKRRGLIKREGIG